MPASWTAEILNLTFTRKAAGELSQRVRGATGTSELAAASAGLPPRWGLPPQRRIHPWRHVIHLTETAAPPPNAAGRRRRPVGTAPPRDARAGTPGRA